MPYVITALTLQTAVQQICKMVGHPSPTDAVGSTDLAVQQMIAAVNVACNELLTMAEWQGITKKTSLTIQAAVPGDVEGVFTLPEDFYRFVDQTQWRRDAMLPALGPISSQAWMQYTVRNWTPQLTLFWQIREGQLYVLNPPTAAVDMDFMYVSQGWIIDQDDANTFKNTADKNGDRFKLDSFLVMLLGRAKYLEWKGFDSAAAMRDFYSIFASRSGGEKGAPILSLHGGGSPMPLLDGMFSVPDTGYGI